MNDASTKPIVNEGKQTLEIKCCPFCGKKPLALEGPLETILVKCKDCFVAWKPLELWNRRTLSGISDPERAISEARNIIRDIISDRDARSSVLVKARAVLALLSPE